MKFYIYIDDDLIPRWMKDVAGRIIDFSDDSIGFAVKLVLNQYREIEKNKVYGPFDVPNYARGGLRFLFTQAHSPDQPPMALNTSEKKAENAKRYWTKEEFEIFLREEGFIAAV